MTHCSSLLFRKQLYPERMPSTKPKLKFRGNLHHSEITDTWCMPFMGSDKSVMTRTQRSFFHDKSQRYFDRKKRIVFWGVLYFRPTQLNCYAQFESIFSCFMLMLVGLIFGFLANYSWGRKLLGKNTNTNTYIKSGQKVMYSFGILPTKFPYLHYTWNLSLPSIQCS